MSEIHNVPVPVPQELLTSSIETFEQLEDHSHDHSEEHLARESASARKCKALKSMAATVAAVSVLLGAAFTIDTRYVHAGELVVESLHQQQQVTDLHSSFLDDKIFELELKKANTPKVWTATDQLILDRYKAKLALLNSLKVQQVNALRSASQDGSK